VKGARLNPFWRQLPVYSPVTFGSLWVGLAGALGRGAPLHRLRKLLLQEYGSDDLILVDSGTSALRLAIEGSLIESGSDIVALPAYCCFDVATAAIGADARVAIYDVQPETLGPDFESLQEALEAGARTIVVVHLYGIPVDLDRSRELADEYGAILIEDAAQGAGGSWRGRQLGAWGDLGILSFGRGKGRTGGGGGALLSNNDRGASILGNLPEIPRNSGGGIPAIVKLAVQWALGRPCLYGIPASLPFLRLGETTYKEPWNPATMAPGPAAALLANWEASQREEETRRLRAAELMPNLPEATVLCLRNENVGCRPGWLRLPAIHRNFLPARCQTQAGIAAGYPVTLYEVVGNPIQPESVADLAGAVALANYLVTYPVHRWCSGTDRSRDGDR
jgi:perosamine synthetase